MSFVGMNWYKHWRDGVEKAYGSLDKFGDAPTIRIQLLLVREWLAEDRRITAQLDDEGKKEWLEVFGEDIEIANAAEAELLAWLDARHLERPANPFLPPPDTTATTLRL